MASSSTVTVTALLAEAASVLEDAGFRAVVPSITEEWKATRTKVYEDAYSIVCVAVYETWLDLVTFWIDDQDNLVRLISKHFARTEAKAWDGYLVLFTPSVVPADARREAVAIQRDTLHVRKLFAAVDELKDLGAVHQTLLPLLPLQISEVGRAGNVLKSLPPLLAARGIEREVSDAAISAFLEQRPIIEAIHGLTMTKRGS